LSIPHNSQEKLPSMQPANSLFSIVAILEDKKSKPRRISMQTKAYFIFFKSNNGYSTVSTSNDYE